MPQDIEKTRAAVDNIINDAYERFQANARPATGAPFLLQTDFYETGGAADKIGKSAFQFSLRTGQLDRSLTKEEFRQYVVDALQLTKISTTKTPTPFDSGIKKALAGIKSRSDFPADKLDISKTSKVDIVSDSDTELQSVGLLLNLVDNALKDHNDDFEGINTKISLNTNSRHESGLISHLIANSCYDNLDVLRQAIDKVYAPTLQLNDTPIVDGRFGRYSPASIQRVEILQARYCLGLLSNGNVPTDEQSVTLLRNLLPEYSEAIKNGEISENTKRAAGNVYDRLNGLLLKQGIDQAHDYLSKSNEVQKNPEFRKILSIAEFLNAHFDENEFALNSVPAHFAAVVASFSPENKPAEISIDGTTIHLGNRVAIMRGIGRFFDATHGEGIEKAIEAFPLNKQPQQRTPTPAASTVEARTITKPADLKDYAQALQQGEHSGQDVLQAMLETESLLTRALKGDRHTKTHTIIVEKDKGKYDAAVALIQKFGPTHVEGSFAEGEIRLHQERQSMVSNHSDSFVGALDAAREAFKNEQTRGEVAGYLAMAKDEISGRAALDSMMDYSKACNQRGNGKSV